MRVGLVLGAGGVVGHAYHAGVLAALEQDLGWDARDAEVIVGTSAGALTGVLLRAGVAASDLAAWNVEAPMTASGEVIRNQVARPQFPPFRVGDLIRVPRPPAVPLLRRMVRSPLTTSPLGVFLAMLPDGLHDLRSHARVFDELVGEWPARPLWINAVRRRDLRRVVLGRDATAPLGDAVAASCAVPGFFEPVRIDGATYVDGGVHSPTNADLVFTDAIARTLDLVVVISPMSASVPTWRRADGMIRRLSQRKLDREIPRAARQAPATASGERVPPVAVFAPGERVLRHITFDFMNEESLNDLVREAFLEAGEQIDAQHIMRTWRAVNTRSARAGRPRPLVPVARPA